MNASNDCRVSMISMNGLAVISRDKNQKIKIKKNKIK